MIYPFRLLAVSCTADRKLKKEGKERETKWNENEGKEGKGRKIMTRK